MFLAHIESFVPAKFYTIGVISCIVTKFGDQDSMSSQKKIQNSSNVTKDYDFENKISCDDNLNLFKNLTETRPSFNFSNSVEFFPEKTHDSTNFTRKISV